MVNKRDLSVPMVRANIIVSFIIIPVAILQFVIFEYVAWLGTDGNNMEPYTSYWLSASRSDPA